MHRSTHRTATRLLGRLALTAALAAPAALSPREAPAQRVSTARGSVDLPRSAGRSARATTRATTRARTRPRALSREAIREMARRDPAYRIVVSLDERRLRVLEGSDVIIEAPVAVGTGLTLRGLGRSWVFDTPRGVRTVQGKKVNPVWIPPDWMYVETAREQGLGVERLGARKPRVLRDGSRLVVRDGAVQVVKGQSTYTPRPDEHLIWDDILFIPPLGTKNRRIERELGKYALDTGDGYLLHGTPYQNTIGQRASHGCLRLKDDDIAWLYANVPVGTKVYLY